MICGLDVLGKQSDAPDAPLIRASDFPKNFQAALSFFLHSAQLTANAPAPEIVVASPGHEVKNLRQYSQEFHAWKHEVEPRHEYDGGNQQCRNKQFHATIVSVSGVVVK